MGLTAGERFAGYRIIRPLGAGGMGEVYLVEHPRLPRQEALKVLSPELSQDSDYRLRFAREADLAARLWHPHIVEVRDRGEDRGQLWISMAYVDGHDAAQLLAETYPSGMPVRQVIPIITAVASALDYAHLQGTLHRDIKPANIFLSAPDSAGESRILLGDFGIARELADPAGMTVTGMTLGTLAYAAPEQLNGDPLDGRADQYALAATTYHLLAGRPLFPATNPVVAISRHLTAEPPKISATHPELAALDHVLGKALAKEPAARYARCSDFAAALAAAASTATPGPIAPSAPTRQAPLPRPASPPPPRLTAPPPPSPRTTNVKTDSGRSRRTWAGAALGALLIIIPGLALWLSATKPWVTDSAPPVSGPSAGSAPVVPPKADPDLGLDVPISRPACDGTAIVVLDSATTPGRYRDDIARALANNPGASYLRTDLSCPSLRQKSDEGNPIYAVYRPAGKTRAQVCAAVEAAGPGTYGRWLDTTSDPTSGISCGTDSVEDVNPDPYKVSPGLYRFLYSTMPARECGLYVPNGKGESLWCEAQFPPDTPPATSKPVDGGEPLVGPPSSVRIEPPNGPELSIGEGNSDKGLPIMPDRRITVGEFACTTLPKQGVECTAPTGGFRIEEGVLVRRDGA